MSRSTLNFWVDSAIALVFLVFLSLHGVVIFVFPEAVESAGWSIWGAPRAAWENARDLSLMVFTLGLLLHLILHWSWICGYCQMTIGRRRGRRVVLTDGEKTLIGVGVLVAAMTFVCAWVGAAEFSVVNPDGPPPVMLRP